MPKASQHPCVGTPTCSALLPKGVRYCEACRQRMGLTGRPTRKEWTQPAYRIRGRRLQEMRAKLFARQPFCVLCLMERRTREATIRDHIIPLAEGGRDDESNEQALCQWCSDLKTQAESLRGRHRAKA